MLGSKNNIRRIEQSIEVQLRNDLSQGCISMIERFGQESARSRGPVHVATRARFTSGSGSSSDGFVGLKPLGNANGLEIHAEDCRHAGVRRASVIKAVDLIDEALQLHVIKILRKVEALGGADSILI